MRKRRVIKRDRIIVYYILVIVFPCLILGILAFRGVKNDQALVEREQREKLIEISQDIIQLTDARLATIEYNFIRIIDSTTPPGKTIFTDSILSEFFDQHQTITGIFYVPEIGQPKMLNKGMMYIPDNLLLAIDPIKIETTKSILDKGWEYEFKQKDYKKALKYYQNIMSEVKEEQSGGEILNAIARIQKKLELENEAIETYDLIWNNYPMIFIQNRIPLGAIALLEKSALYFKKLDPLSALRNIQALLNQIQKSKWEIGYSNYAFILSKADKIIMECENSNKGELNQLLYEIRSKKDSISISETHTEYLLAFLGSQEIIANDHNPGKTNSVDRLKARINTKSYFWSIPVENNNGYWGLIIDTDHLLKNTILSLIHEKASSSNFCWEVTDEYEKILMKSDKTPEGQIPVLTDFPSNMPSLSLILYPEDSGLFLSLINSREGLFFYIFIVIIIILAFGLFFTLRTINNEIQFSKMKSNFMSTVSHEFKSPLTSIRQMAEMLDQERVPSKERKKKYYHMILLQSERLSHLIENILDFSKMEGDQKSFRFETSNIYYFLRNVVASFNKNTDDQGFQIHLSMGDSICKVAFDKEAMEQVMHNLLDNACKYSGDSKTINVEMVDNGQNVVINITDFGVGISKNDRDKIFDRFYRAGDELTQSVKGSGIGLTIVKQIVEAHKGDIVVDSSPGKGSTFSVILPKA